VRGRLSDGYHRIETIFAFAEAGDRLIAETDRTLSLTATGAFASALPSGNDNLVLRAARALQRRHAVTSGAAIQLEKNLPVAAGLGGGSADAAAVLRLLARLWALPSTGGVLSTLAEELGADVPACLTSQPAWGEGRGDSIVPADGASIAAVPVLLVNPGVALSTADVFAAWDGADRGPLAREELLAAALAGRNDLEAPACTLVPAIGTALDALRQMPGVQLVRMSGSGATCFALFEDEEDRDSAAERISAAHPGWWQLTTRLRS
jgi:4-diphosphocytidyl-2-C-methyl-D-erythritol kinase